MNLSTNIIIIRAVYKMFSVFPIKRNKIVFSSYMGKGFGDNGKYIALELLKQPSKYDIVWLCKNMDEHFPEGIRKVKYRSLKSIYEQVTAKIWVDNTRKPEYVCKRNGQYYIMTWHGGLGLKRVEKDAEKLLDPSYVERAKRDSRMADLFLSESEWTTELYDRAFWYNGEILKAGVPRQDILFTDSSALRKKIMSRYGLNEDTHIILYAPTFRNNMGVQDLKLFKLNWNLLLKALENRFGGRWRGFIRLHPNISNLDDGLLLHENGVFDVTDYPDMQELLSIADAVITDYSSCIFDFGLTKRPGFILAKDIKSYSKERNFTIQWSDVPFAIAESDEELVNIIENFDSNFYEKKLYQFYHNYCGMYPTGQAAEAVARRIDEVISGGM